MSGPGGREGRARCSGVDEVSPAGFRGRECIGFRWICMVDQVLPPGCQWLCPVVNGPKHSFLCPRAGTVVAAVTVDDPKPDLFRAVIE